MSYHALFLLQEGIVAFNCNQIESFYIVSTPRSDEHTVTPAGHKFASKVDARIKVNFPAGSVSQDSIFEFKVSHTKYNIEYQICKLL